MKKITVVTLALMSLLAVNAAAFDGQRKGFVLGGGLGVAPVVKWEGTVDVYDQFGTKIGTDVVDESNVGVGINILIGYAWDEQNMIVAEGNVGGMESEILIGEPTITQGFGGISWYHYFGEMGATFFTVVGLGSYSFEVEDFEAKERGGFLLGGGYEFSPHWQVGAYLSFGETKDVQGKNEHTTFNILVGGVAF